MGIERFDFDRLRQNPKVQFRLISMGIEGLDFDRF